MRIAVLYSTWRPDEERIAAAAEKRGHEVVRIDERQLRLDLAPLDRAGAEPVPDVLLERCRGHARALAALTYFEAVGVPTVNRLAVARTCGNKVYVTGALARARVPTPPTIVAFAVEAALAACETLGYPVMLKPLVGDQGELVAKVDGRDAARAILEHKRALAGAGQELFYVQRYLERPGRDIRCFVVGDEVVGAVYFINNRAVPAEEDSIVAACPLGAELRGVALAAAAAVGGGVLAVDLIEGADGLAVTEVNYTIEFARVAEALAADIPARVIDFVEAQAARP